MFPGNYRATILGENLEGLELEVCSGDGATRYQFTSGISDGQARVCFSVREAAPDLEIRMTNVSGRQVCISSFVLVMED